MLREDWSSKHGRSCLERKREHQKQAQGGNTERTSNLKLPEPPKPNNIIKN